jgi:hypothetical protein
MDRVDKVAAGVAALFVVAMCVIVALATRDCQQRRACEDSGGRVEEYDCHTIYVTQSCGSGCSVTVPEESCSWRCVGGRP